MDHCGASGCSCDGLVARGRAAVPVPGLVAAYAFSEGSGTTTTDSSGNGNGGELTNATWTTGKFGNALSFNGTSALVTVPDSPSLDLTTGMTLEAWVSPNAGDAWADVIYKGQNDTYYLAGSAPEGPPGAGGTFSAQPVLGTSALPAQRLVSLGCHLRRTNADPVCQWNAGRKSSWGDADCDFIRSPHPRGRLPLRAVVRREDRRGSDLQRCPDRKPDSDRHDDAGRFRLGLDSAYRHNDLAVVGHAGVACCPALGGGIRQRRRSRRHVQDGWRDSW